MALTNCRPETYVPEISEVTLRHREQRLLLGKLLDPGRSLQLITAFLASSCAFPEFTFAPLATAVSEPIPVAY